MERLVACLAAWLTVLPALAQQGGDGTLGRFAPEARYNRAIALARLGRSTEATAALHPFAEGLHGSYRQADAACLRDALHAPALRGR